MSWKEEGGYIEENTLEVGMEGKCMERLYWYGGGPRNTGLREFECMEEWCVVDLEAGCS